MKKLLAAALLALSVATPAQAQFKAASTADIESAKQIIRKVASLGVNIVTPSTCPDGILGRYHSSTSTLTICPRALSDDSLAVEVVAHEAVHVAQHCAGGALGLNSVDQERRAQYARGIDSLNEGKEDHIARVTARLDDAEALMEHEAYAFENSPAAVLTILNKVCG